MGKSINRYWFVTLIALFLLNSGGIQAATQTPQPKNMAEQTSFNPSINSSIYDSLNAYYQSAEYKQMQKEEKSCEQKVAELMKKYPIDWFVKRYGIEENPFAEGGCEDIAILEENKKLSQYDVILKETTTEEKKAILINVCLKTTSKLKYPQLVNDQRLKGVVYEIMNQLDLTGNEEIKALVNSEIFVMTDRGNGGLSRISKIEPYHKYIAIKSVRMGCSMDDFDPKLRDDKDIILGAMKKSGLSLLYASDRLKNDDLLVLTGIRETLTNWGYGFDKNGYINLEPQNIEDRARWEYTMEKYTKEIPDNLPKLKFYFQNYKTLKYPTNLGGK